LLDRNTGRVELFAQAARRQRQVCASGGRTRLNSPLPSPRSGPSERAGEQQNERRQQQQRQQHRNNTSNNNNNAIIMQHLAAVERDDRKSAARARHWRKVSVRCRRAGGLGGPARIAPCPAALAVAPADAA
jgi:hypothetical protein